MMRSLDEEQSDIVVGRDEPVPHGQTKSPVSDQPFGRSAQDLFSPVGSTNTEDQGEADWHCIQGWLSGSKLCPCLPQMEDGGWNSGVQTVDWKNKSGTQM
jgi:hypothetical protein